MDLRDRPHDSAFRADVRQFLEDHLVGEFAEIGGRGGSGDESFGFETRLRWEKVLADGGWTGLGWPTEHGGRGASITEQVIFYEEYARAAAPGRVSVMGEGLLGPTLIHYGTPAQQERFLPPIRQGTELWCQGYSEPGAGSDLANVATRAVLDGDQWLVTGQKVWTSLAHQADWCFVVCRTDPGSQRHHGLSYLLVPMDQPGVEVRPIMQLTRTSEFNEVFFDGARTDRANVVGQVGDGWRVALATLSFERGVALLGYQLGFVRELDRIVALAQENGRAGDPVIRQRLARAHVELTIMRYNTLRSLAGIDGPVASPQASIAKLYWGSWHRRLGELALSVLGTAATVLDPGDYEPNDLQRSFLFSRAETIYGGSNQIQRNIIGERVLGLPPEPKGNA
jgi:alkylation response protein AidB-like acyl-CoA dehydrogenase